MRLRRIAQGVEAGGHVRGSVPALQLLAEARAALPPGYPLWLAGGIAGRDDAQAALAAGAEAAVAGTRFLLTEESRAHPAYKQRLLAAEETILTDLFGAAWPAPHRVVPNSATEHWFSSRRSSFPAVYRGKDERRQGDGAAPGLVRAPLANRALNRLLAPGARYVPDSWQARMVRAQHPGSRLLTPAGPTDDGPETLIDAGALYAGESVARIDTVSSAASVVHELAS